jgi:hypothetical protein
VLVSLIYADDISPDLTRQGLSFERAAVGSWIAVGAAEEVVAT